MMTAAAVALGWCAVSLGALACFVAFVSLVTERHRNRRHAIARHPASRDHAADLTDELIRSPIVRAMPVDEAATWLATAREIADARYADEFSA